MNVLEIQHLSKQFGSHQVLRDLNFQVPEHSVYGFLGQNGAGKTTTMKIILGLLKADKGEVKVLENRCATAVQRQTAEWDICRMCLNFTAI